MPVAPVDAVALYVVAVVFVATLIRSTFGFGEALIAVPVLAFRIPIAVAAPLAVLVSIVVAGLIVIQDWRRVESRAAGGLVISALFGIPLGLLLLTRATDEIVKGLLAIVIIVFSIYSLGSRHVRYLRDDQAGWMITCGFLSGVLGGAYGMNGPPLVVYGTFRRWSPQHFRATLQGYFLPASLVGLAGYASIGLWNRDLTRYFLLSLPAVLIATALGGRLNKRLDGRRFLQIVHVGLLLIGAALLVQATSGNSSTAVVPGPHHL